MKQADNFACYAFGNGKGSDGQVTFKKELVTSQKK